MTRVYPTTTDHPLIGKRINHAGIIGSVTHVDADGLIAWVKYDKFLTNGTILVSIAAELPAVISRASLPTY